MTWLWLVADGLLGCCLLLCLLCSGVPWALLPWRPPLQRVEAAAAASVRTLSIQKTFRQNPPGQTALPAALLTVFEYAQTSADPDALCCPGAHAARHAARARADAARLAAARAP